MGKEYVKFFPENVVNELNRRYSECNMPEGHRKIDPTTNVCQHCYRPIGEENRSILLAILEETQGLKGISLDPTNPALRGLYQREKNVRTDLTYLYGLVKVSQELQ